METLTSAYIALPSIDQALCHACNKCLARQVCRTRAITAYDPGEPSFVDSSRCYGCRACMPACPFGAIIIESRRS